MYKYCYSNEGAIYAKGLWGVDDKICIVLYRIALHCTALHCIVLYCMNGYDCNFWRKPAIPFKLGNY